MRITVAQVLSVYLTVTHYNAIEGQLQTLSVQLAKYQEIFCVIVFKDDCYI